MNVLELFAGSRSVGKQAEMMATTDITLEEFEEVLQMWISIKKKELSIAEFENNYR
jgi:hypothetical protein